MKSLDKKNTEDLVIGLDSSTTGTKTFAINRKGEIVAHAYEIIPLFSPQPYYFEQDPVDWWSSAQKTLKKITKLVHPGRIKALAISNQRETFVALNKAENAVRPAIIWLDERCRDEVELFSKKIGERKIHRITGKPVDYAPVIYRLSWMKKNESDLFKKIYMICDVQSYLVHKLTDSFSTSRASADPFGLFDMRKMKWSSLILNALELTENRLPGTFCPGTVIGKITKKASELTGLNTGTLVVAGGGDGQAAGTGVNALSSECAYLNLGTAVVAGIYGKIYRISKAFRTMSSCSENGYYYESSLRAGTFAIDWFIKNIMHTDIKKQPGIYNELEQYAAGISPGSDKLLYLPYLCGAMNPYWDSDARSAFIGLSSSHHYGHMYRSILEGIAFEQLLAIQNIEKNIGIRIKDFIAIGGGSKSELWCHILADITGKNICIPKNNEASGLGAAIAAAIGTGWYATFKEAANKMTSVNKVIKPDMRNLDFYLRRYKSYKRIYPCLKDI